MTASRAGWLRTLHQWHWISSALCLVGMLLFAFTGITLNHAGDIEARPEVTERRATLPEALRESLAPQDDEADRKAPLPPALQAWSRTALALPLPEGALAEWSADEVYLSLPRPGGDAWLRLDRASGEVEAEVTDRGWIALLNDLHKGRHAGLAWRWFLDLFSAACVVFAVTGLLILKQHAAQRPSAWPLVGAGLVIPLLLVLLFIH